jgi:hypothetical protein
MSLCWWFSGYGRFEGQKCLHLRIQTVQEEDLASVGTTDLQKAWNRQPSNMASYPNRLNACNPKSPYYVHKNKLLNLILSQAASVV